MIEYSVIITSILVVIATLIDDTTYTWRNLLARIAICLIPGINLLLSIFALTVICGAI
jgi:hypothetical protein